MRAKGSKEKVPAGVITEVSQFSTHKVEQEPTLSISAKVILVVVMALLITLFVMIWSRTRINTSPSSL